MFFSKISPSQALITVNDLYAHLIDIKRNGDLVFEFTYSISQSKAIKQKLTLVEIVAYSKIIQPKTVTAQTVVKGNINVDILLKNALTQMTNAKNAQREQDSYIVSSVKSSVSAHINNEIVTALRNGVNPSEISQMQVSVLKSVALNDLRDQDDNQPLLTYSAERSIINASTALSSSLNIRPKDLMTQMLYQGIDPSHIVSMNHRSVSAYDAKQGLSKKNRSNDRDDSFQTKLLNYHLFSSENIILDMTSKNLSLGTTTLVLSQETKDEIEIPVKMILPISRLTDVNGRITNSVILHFNLKDSQGNVVQTIAKTLDLSLHTQIYMTPKKPPIVQVSSGFSDSHATLQVKRGDNSTNGFSLYKKTIYGSDIKVDDYVLIGEFQFSETQQSINVIVDKPTGSLVLYRVIPIGKTKIPGYEYTNVILKPRAYHTKKILGLSVATTLTGVRVDITNIPENIIAVQLVARDLSRFESSFSNVGEPQLIDDSTREHDSVSIADLDVIDGTTYEYAVRCYQKNGTQQIIGHTTFSYTRLQPEKISTTINDLTVTNDNPPNVTFTITSIINDTNINVVRELLMRNDILQYFDNDVQKEREFLSKLLAHSVQRVNLSTGAREDLGILSSDQFNDFEQSKKIGALPLISGQKYRYEIFALLRSPETMLDSLRKQKIDSVTKKPYEFSPSKFLHPITLQDGVIVSSIGIVTRYAKEQMTYGSVGITATTDVSFEDFDASIIDLNAEQIDKFNNQLSWRIQGATSFIDHFLIMKEVNGVRTMIGKVHSVFEHENCKFIHEIGKRDIGELTYLVIPIFNNYELGETVRSNTLMVT